MQKGTVKFFNQSKGFGFIVPESGEKDLFVHSSGIKNKINEGDKVTYEVQPGPKGLCAVNVQTI